MHKTTVVNINKTVKYDVYMGRARLGHDGYFGNPFKLQPGESRGATIERYRKYFYDAIEIDAEFKERILALKGKVLGCYCKPHACHVDVIIEYLENDTSIHR